MLDYGFRSKCCSAPIRVGFKRMKLSNTRKTIWVCTKCQTRDVNIVAKADLENQTRD